MTRRAPTRSGSKFYERRIHAHANPNLHEFAAADIVTPKAFPDLKIAVAEIFE
jgi:hypothetical protein